MLYKPTGWTPEVIKYIKKNKEYKFSKLYYAGRLDPLCGLMIILKDEECKKQNLYHNFSKTYNFKLLLGISSDTYDILGKITQSKKYSHISKIKIIDLMNRLIGKQNQYQNLIHQLELMVNLYGIMPKNNTDTKIPLKEITINSINFINQTQFSKEELLIDVYKKINMISSDNSENFRQKEIIQTWNKIENQNYQIIEMNTNVSCGTYIRGLCHLIGKHIGIPCIALDIYRTTIDEFNINNLL